MSFQRETRLENDEVIEYVDSELRADRFRFYTNLRLQSVLDEIHISKTAGKYSTG